MSSKLKQDSKRRAKKSEGGKRDTSLTWTL